MPTLEQIFKKSAIEAVVVLGAGLGLYWVVSFEVAVLVAIALTQLMNAFSARLYGNYDDSK